MTSKTIGGPPWVTVLMPNYNNEIFLNEAIDSILNQTFSNFIFLIVDDGSTDKSIEIIKSYNDKRIFLIQKNNNSGIVDTLNIGLQNLSTKYFVRMDGDDISVQNRIELLYHFMENNPNVGVCGSNVAYFGNSTLLTNYSLNNNRIKARLVFTSGISHPGSIFRTSVLKDNNILYRNNHPYMEDYDLFMRIKKYTEFANIPEVLYRYRFLEHNSTVRNMDTLLVRYKEIYKNVLSELNIELTNKNVETHLELFLGNSISFKIKDYKDWINLLVSQNKKFNVYPYNELQEVLHDRWDKFFFKIAPLSLHNNIQYFLLSDKLSFRQLLYLLKCKINKLIGRNHD